VTGCGIDRARTSAGRAVTGVVAETKLGAKARRSTAADFGALTAGLAGAAARSTVDDDWDAARAGWELSGLTASSQTVAKMEAERVAETPRAVRTREELSLMEISLPPDNSIRFGSAPAASC
jgi:hypothetical protein